MNQKEFKKEDLKKIEEIGISEYAKVYLAEYHGKNYAVKEISKKLIAKSEKKDYLIDAVKKEIDIQKMMSQFENSVKYYLDFEDDQYYIIIIEVCDESLADLLNKKKN
jgi:serine/threonine protein kinase